MEDAGHPKRERDFITTDKENKKITIAGDLKELVAIVKAIHRAELPDEDHLELDRKINTLLLAHIPHIKKFLAGITSAEEFQATCVKLPQLTLTKTHKIRFAVDTEAKNPKIIVEYFHEAPPTEENPPDNEDPFREMREIFEIALADM